MDNDIGVFADQVLTAKSWYKGKNALAAEDALKDMIETTIKNTAVKLQTILDTAAARVQQTIN